MLLMTNIPNLTRMKELCLRAGLPVSGCGWRQSSGSDTLVSFQDRASLLANSVNPHRYRCAYQAGLVGRLCSDQTWVVREIHPLECGFALTSTGGGTAQQR